ncbi:MAG: DEAD/DEAH box helicase [bacterium]
MLAAFVQRFESSVVSRRTLPARAASFADWPPDLEPAVVAAAAGQSVSRPYSHQAAAIRALLDDRSVTLASPTASGKSLVYQGCAFHWLLREPEATVLYVAPTKALAHDQQAQLARWCRAIPGSPEVATYDGDTPRASRAELRRRARFLLTNPEMLHLSILPNHPRWARFLAGLRLVVLDELHTYRGVFGSHVANVVRRLRRLVEFHRSGPSADGPRPLFACCSATIANPGELAERLTGAPSLVITDSGAPRGERCFVFCVPPVIDPALGIRARFLDEVEQVTRFLLSAGVQTIVFTRTRRATEELTRLLRRTGEGGGEWAEQAVRAYRAGYRPARRRAIEAGLRDGSVRAVVSTSALELGVDVGRLDACVLAGYPGSVASLNQRAGRVGRRSERSVVVLVTGAGALEQYVAHHPELVLDRSVERAQVDPNNPLILLQHLRCAAAELPLREGESLAPGDAAEIERELLEILAEQGQLRARGGRVHWVGSPTPAQQVGLRSLGTDPIELLLGEEHGAAPDRVLGTVDRAVAPSVVHPGAVYLHEGVPYRVERLDWDEGRAELAPHAEAYVTIPRQELTLIPIRVTERREVPGGTAQHGELARTVHVTGYREVDPSTGEVLAEREVWLPPQRSTSCGYWLTLAPALVERLRQGGWWRRDAVGYRGPDWQAQRRLVRARDGFACVHCGESEAARQHDIHHLRPFRSFGYVRGVNRAHREANQSDNLVTLCRSCHARAENNQRFQGALERLAYVLGNVAPLLLMCDPRDLDVRVGLTVDESVVEQASSLALVERAPAGVGFGESLFRLHEELLRNARRLVDGCGCQRGCPACVGPAAGGARDGRQYALAILSGLGTGPAEAAA